MLSSTPEVLAAAQALVSALAVGLVVGLERGWSQRELADGGRVAGLRTFGLIGILGGLLGRESAGPIPLAVGLASVALLFAVSYQRASMAADSLSITTAVAALVTFLLGALAARGQPLLAIAGAVLVALLLDLKAALHRWLRLIQPPELNALLQLGVISAVVLPLLPDVGYGPYASLNPFRLWVAVILIASLSLAGHVSTRLAGDRQGLLWTGILGGLASSTATTLALARTARGQAPLAQPAAAGIIAACGVMFARMAVVVIALQPGLGIRLGGLLLLLATVSFATAAWQWRRQAASVGPGTPVAGGAKVFDLTTAVVFGGALAAISVLTRAAQDTLGAAGLYGVAFLSGLADVDAVLISGMQMAAQGQVAPATAAITALLAAGANLLVKAAMAWTVGGAAVGRPVFAAYMLVVGAGAAALAASALA